MEDFDFFFFYIYTYSNHNNFFWSKFKSDHAPGEHREQYIGEIRQGMSKLKFNMEPISLLIYQILKVLGNQPIWLGYRLAGWHTYLAP